jgi:phage FluMu protein Com
MERCYHCGKLIKRGGTTWINTLCDSCKPSERYIADRLQTEHDPSTCEKCRTALNRILRKFGRDLEDFREKDPILYYEY